MKIRIPMFLPILAVIALLLGVFFFHQEGSKPLEVDGSKILRDSLIRARTVDSMRLEAYADSVLQLRGDSLRDLFSRTARRVRSPPPSTSTPDTTILRDTVCLAGEDVRTILIHDSSVIVSRDSARNFLAECSDSLAIAKQSKYSSHLRNLGFTISGISAVLLAVLLWGTD